MPSETEKNGASEQAAGSPPGQVPPRPAPDAERGGGRIANFLKQMNTVSRHIIDRIVGLAVRYFATARILAAQSATNFTAAAQGTTQRVRREIVLFPLRARSHFRQRRTLYTRFGTFAVVLSALFISWAGIGLWSSATNYCSLLSPSVFQQVAVALGASVSGLLAIVFALTTFAIQQVAAREAAEVVLEYAQDRRMASTYWMLASIAGIFFALPFVHLAADFLPTELISFGILLGLTFLLIYRHFKIVMLYSDPRFTVERLHQRGIRDLRTVARTVDRIKRATQNQR